MAIDRRAFGNFDWFLFGMALFISMIGIMTIYSSMRPVGLEEGSNLYLKQMIWLCIALVTMGFFVMVDYTWFERYAGVLYIAGLLSLVLVLFVGKVGMGAKRWIQIGPLTIQPSEIFKVFFIILIASKISKIRGNLNFLDVVKIGIIYLMLPFLLILKEPDLGSGMILFVIFFLVTILRGFYKKALVIMIIVGTISGLFLGNVVWSKLKPYQKNRIIAFINPKVDPSGIGYQIEQSKITVGSGRFLGKGYLKGTQGPFRFLPENHTDFIFSVFAEEWGFVGSFFLLLLYLIVILRGLDTAIKAKDGFGRFLAISIVIMFFVYFLINIGMVLGMMPVVGVPFPFMSYGGTALVTNFAAVGILINVRMRRFALFY